MSSSSSTTTRGVPKDKDAATPVFDLERLKTERNDTHTVPAELVQSHIEKPQSITREILFVSILCMAQFMNQAGLAMSLSPLHIIGKSFGIQNSPGQLSWLIAAYSLTVGTFILPAGRLGDLFGHKRFFIGGFLWFGLWSALAGFSVYSTPRFFDCCRALQGIGPAFLMPNAMAIMGRTYPPGRRKEMIFALFGATAPTGSVVGAILSGLIAQDLWWPWSFWIFAITCFILGILGLFIIPHTPSPVMEKDGISIWERIDFLGSLVGVSGLVLFNFAWNQGPVAGWPVPYVYAILILGSLLIALFFFVESRARFPLLPFDSLNKQTAFVLGCIATGWSSFSIWLFYTYQFLLILRGESPLLASTHFIPCAISGLVAAVCTGYLLSRIPASFIMMISLTAFTTGLIIAATAPVNQIYWAQTFVSVCIMPWGMDMSFPAGTLLLSNSMPKEHQGIAASLINTVVNYSISIALGIAGTIEGQVNDNGTNVLRGYKGAYYFGIGMAAFGLVISFFFVLHEIEEKKKHSKALPPEENDD